MPEENFIEEVDEIEPKPEPKPKKVNPNIEKLNEIKSLINTVIKNRTDTGQLKQSLELIEELIKEL